jgi:hypothetical protein
MFYFRDVGSIKFAFRRHGWVSEMVTRGDVGVTRLIDRCLSRASRQSFPMIKLDVEMHSSCRPGMKGVQQDSSDAGTLDKNFRPGPELGLAEHSRC